MNGRRSHFAALRNARLMWADAESIAPPTVLTSTATLPATGGTIVLTGTGFLQMRRVLMGTQVLGFSVTDDNNMTISVPTGQLDGSLYVIVETRGGQVYPPFQVAFTPGLSSNLPIAGPAAGGAPVILTGSGLLLVTDVTLDGVAQAFVIDSNTQITMTTAAALAGGPYNIVATAPSGSATLAGAFTYT